MTQRSLNALETKNKLHSTALALFTKRGYDKVTVDDITRYAGVSKGTFYNHFTSKEAVLVEQFHKIDDHYEQVFKHVSENESAINCLKILFSTMCEFCMEVCGINTMRVVYINQISLGHKPNILTNKSRTFYTLLLKFVMQGQASGEISNKMPAEELVDMLARNARSILYEWCLHDGVYDLQEAGKNVIDIFQTYTQCLDKQ